MFSLSNWDSKFRFSCFTEVTVARHWKKAEFRLWRIMCPDRELKQKSVSTVTVLCKDDTLPNPMLPWRVLVLGLKYIKLFSSSFVPWTELLPHTYMTFKSQIVCGIEIDDFQLQQLFCLFYLKWIVLKSIADLFEVHPVSLTYWYLPKCTVIRVVLAKICCFKFWFFFCVKT